MTKIKNAHICYFEIPADNLERSKMFYSELFDWNIEEEEEKESPTEYLMIRHGGEEGKIKSGEHPKYFAGMLKREYPGQSILIYIEVPSIEEYTKKVRSLGGTVVVDKKAVPGWGYLAVCKDIENNTFALWEINHRAS